MALPLLLAGPILRRVEPSLACVWLALRDPCNVRLKVWEGLGESGRPNPLVESPITPAVRVGDQLHVVVVTAEIPPAAGVSFQPDALYSYDVEIRDAGGTVHTLASLRMLEGGEFDDFVRLPLGYETGQLPSFAPPPSKLEDLNLLYGSCRRPGHVTPDALALVDDLISADDRWQSATKRPHQLFLGGDQVYADDVEQLHLLVVAEAAVPLIGTTGDPGFPDPVEHLRVDKIAARVDEAFAASDTPWRGYQVVEDPPNVDRRVPADRAHFPEGRRLNTTLIDAQFTSSDGTSHVLSLGEFAALYLSAWSPAIWGKEVALATFAVDGDAPLQSAPFNWDKELRPYNTGAANEGAVVMPPIPTPPEVAAHLYVAPRTTPEPEHDEKAEAKRKFKAQRSLRREFAVLQAFRRGLPKVQRALANVPTYMILDDHDVTDDYFLNPIWRDRVLGTKLGQSILGNAMIAYALFQDWGNDPRAYRAGVKAELLALVPQLFPHGVTPGPDRDAFEAIAQRLGHAARPAPLANGEFPSADPALKWHFTVDGPKHRVVVFDNRTRRSYVSQLGPPGNVSATALLDQLPLPPLPAGREILIVVAPLQVIGAPVLDDIVAPLSYRIFDAVAAKDTASNLDPSSPTGLRQMTGTNPDAIEAWAFDAKTFEHLLERLEPYRRVVLLSGDVHYSAGTLMSYWRGDQRRPARFAQFTSSGFKNVMPSFITFVDRALGFAQQLIRLNLGTERLGWDRPEDDLVLFPPGRNKFDLRPVLRSKLGSAPVLLPSWGWPDDNDPAAQADPALTTRLNPAKPPDWRWRIMPLLDERRDSLRPAGIQILPLNEGEVDTLLGDPATVVSGYHQVAGRHQHSLEKLRNARQILFRGNVGRVTFRVHGDGRLDAIHEVITAFNDPDAGAAAEPKPEAFLVQVAPLGPDDEDPPSHLRKKAL
jgi:hypothetical protein